MAKKQALLSVYDKTGLETLARALIELGFDLVSTGGTAKAIREAGLTVSDVSDITEFPEGLGGRVKSLHPAIHAGILANLDLEGDRTFLEANGIEPFDLVVCNLYPFTDKPSIEMIDIGGPTMVRGAAKNYAHVAILSSPSQYDEVIEELRETGALSNSTRRNLAEAAFEHTARYELPIAEWISNSDTKGLIGTRVRDLTYGENPDQRATLYSFLEDRLSTLSFELIPDTGRIPGYVNVTDIDRCLATMRQVVASQYAAFPNLDYLSVAVAVKHGNACGIGVAATPDIALQKMIFGDLQAIMGAVVMTNFTMTGELATVLREFAVDLSKDSTFRPRILDGVCAPSFDDDAITAIQRTDGKFFLAHDARLAELDETSLSRQTQFRPVDGGFLVQSTRSAPLGLDGATIHGAPLTKQQTFDVTAGMAIAGTSNSNTICLMVNGMLAGLAAGQQKRNAACELALTKAEDSNHDVTGAVAVSDGFFPFAIEDGPEALLWAGIKVIVSPGGSRIGDKQMLELLKNYDFTWVELPAKNRMFSNH